MSWGKLKYHIWFTIYVFHAKCDMIDAPFRRCNLLKVVICPWKVIQVQFKCLEVNWQFIDDFLYVFLINYGQNVLSVWNIALLNFIKGQCYKVHWKAIYDLLYVFHTNFDHMMHHLWDTTPWKVCELDLTLKCNPRSKVTS